MNYSSGAVMDEGLGAILYRYHRYAASKIQEAASYLGR